MLSTFHQKGERRRDKEILGAIKMFHFWNPIFSPARVFQSKMGSPSNSDTSSTEHWKGESNIEIRANYSTLQMGTQKCLLFQSKEWIGEKNPGLLDLTCSLSSSPHSIITAEFWSEMSLILEIFVSISISQTFRNGGARILGYTTNEFWLYKAIHKKTLFLWVRTGQTTITWLHSSHHCLSTCFKTETISIWLTLKCPEQRPKLWQYW